MTQRTLFDIDPEPIGFYGQTIEKPLARSTDPETSKIAAVAAGIAASEAHKQLAAWLSKQSEPKTCREIAEGTKAELGLPQEVETLRKRAGELEDIAAVKLGFQVVVAGVRKCSFTGKLAETWEVRK